MCAENMHKQHIYVRLMTEADWPQVAAIYEQGIVGHKAQPNADNTDCRPAEQQLYFCFVHSLWKGVFSVILFIDFWETLTLQIYEKVSG